ncbi:MAG: hypothetical protein ACR2NA_09085 [Solirubrobacterales bacterium]
MKTTAGPGVRLFHWRDGRREVDLVYNDPAASAAFEIASSDRHDRSGLHALADRFPRLASERWLVAPNAAPVLPEDSGDRGHRARLPAAHATYGRDEILAVFGRLVPGVRGAEQHGGHPPQELDRLARIPGISRAALIREIIDRGVGGDDGDELAELLEAPLATLDQSRAAHRDHVARGVAGASHRDEDQAGQWGPR